ncbi:hypothetical protein ESA94_17515 [Lacibacter luteus]|uniref:PKD family protein n=1 Tax=Lacibacter luteus TaxID=2508719 RepID=A0A4Q1CF00_9BACT|nr:PKD-like family lipoprotein [Lacibacter luteus]RXK58435.1 hypothetical protein ESA94_17515 [Lacibacter luteus]
MNKQSFYISFVLVAALAFFAGCYKDKGNYDYTSVNKITVTDARAANRIFVFQGDTLRLSPAITQTIQTEGLTYLWFVYNNSSNSAYNLPRDTISRVKDLNYVVDSRIFVLGENYRLTLKVTDPKTGVSAFILYDLTVSNKLGEGWMLFEDKGGEGDVSMILPNNTIERKVYSSINPTAPLGKPVAINATSFSITDDLSSPGKRIYLLTENDGQELNALTLQKKFPFGYLYFATPSVVKPTFQGWTAYLSGVNPFQRMGVSVNNGKVHVNLVGGFPGIKKWGEALSTPDGGFDYDMATDIAGAASFSATYPIVMFDKKYKRFYSVGTTRLASFPAAASTVFDMNNVGLDLLKLDSSNVSGVWSAVMKDATTPYLLQFKTLATAADPVITTAKISMNAPGLTGTNVITASTLTPHIYYGAGNTITKYETTSNTTAMSFSFAAGETVTKLVYQKVVPGTGAARLVAVTWNGTESKVYYFTVSAVGDLGATYTNVFTGFSKIVDLVYKVP